VCLNWQIIYDFHDIKSFFDYENNTDTFEGFFYATQNFRVSAKFDNAYHFDIYRNVYLGATLAKGLNYEFFAYIEGDNILGDKSKDVIRELKNEMMNNNKKMMFLEGPKRDDFKNMNHYISTIFAGNPEYFVNNLKLPIWYEEWLKDTVLNTHAFELFFYMKFNHLSENFLLKPHVDVLNRMTDSTINKLSKNDDHFLNNVFYYNDAEPNRIYSFFLNNTNENIDIKLYQNGEIFFHQSLGINWFNINSYDIDFLKDKDILLVIDNGVGMKYDIKKKLDDRQLESIKYKYKIEFF